MQQGEFNLIGVGVDAEDATSVSLEQLHGELSDQPQTDHHYVLAQSWIRHPHRLKCDRAQGGEGRRFRVHARGHAGAQLGGHRDNLCMAGEEGAGAGHQVTHLETLHACADLQYGARGTVAQGKGRVEPAHGLSVGFDGALFASFVHHLTHQVS